ncbi:MAG: hypothetical protein ACM31L_15000 [Actinomycetota bacterium]
MLKRLLSLGAAAAAALVGGCDGPVTIAGTWRSPAAASSLVYATTGGPLWVDVHGSPFGAAAPEFRAKVVEAMSGQTPSRPFGLTAVREQAVHPDFRVAVAFGPPADLDPKLLCTGGPVPTTPPGAERITLLAAFCGGEDVLAWVRGRVDKATGPDDKRFRSLLAQAARDLFAGP